MSSDIGNALKKLNLLVKPFLKTQEWMLNQADQEINNLHEKWIKLCEETQTAESEKFHKECAKIIEECNLYQYEIIARSESMAEKTREQIPVINALTGDNEIVNDLLDQLIDKLWNISQRRYLSLIYNQSLELEKRIRNMLKYALSLKN